MRRQYISRLALPLMMGLPFGVSANAQQVELSAHVPRAALGGFECSQVRVAVRGGAPLGTWTEDAAVLLHHADCHYRGHVRVTSASQGDILDYKFVLLRPDGDVSWEDRPNRRLYVPASDTALSTAVFGGEGGERLERSTRVMFEIDTRQALQDEYPIEGIAIAGGADPLSWEERDGYLHAEPSGTGILQATVAFPAGARTDIPFKLRVKRAGRWKWEQTPGHINHVLDLRNTQEGSSSPASLVLIRLTYEASARSFTTDRSRGVGVDQFASLAQRAHEFGREDYQSADIFYSAAIEALIEGKLQQADAWYMQFRRLHPYPLLDDYPLLGAHRLAKERNWHAGIALLERAQARESVPHLRDLNEYFLGELLLTYAGDNAVQVTRGRGVLRRLMEQGAAGSLAIQYARGALASSLLSEPDSVGLGIAMLERISTDPEIPEEEHRLALLKLAGVHLLRGEGQPALGYLERVAQLGTTVERVDARLRRMRALISLGQYAEVSAQLEVYQTHEVTMSAAVETDVAYVRRHGMPSQRREALLIGADALHQQGLNESARAWLQRIVAEAPESAQAAEAQRRLRR